MTLVEKAAAKGVVIKRKKLTGYAIYRVQCSACPNNFIGNFDSSKIDAAINAHARTHLA